MLENLKKYRIILGSKSPRRSELLKMLGISFDVITIDNIDESYPSTLSPEYVPEYIAKNKAKAYTPLITDSDLVITADTIVVCDKTILGKPKSKDHAIDMLMQLSGKTHKVITGVSILTLDENICFSVSTDVTFSNISIDEAKFYVNEYSPLDKAGAYGIQEWIGAAAVESINGSFYNVMGLPVNRLYQYLKKL